MLDSLFRTVLTTEFYVFIGLLASVAIWIHIFISTKNIKKMLKEDKRRANARKKVKRYRRKS